MSDSPQPKKRRRTEAHGRKPSNGHALMAVSEFLQGIAAALTVENTGPNSPQRKTNAIKIIMKIPELSKEEKTQVLRLIRADTGIADAFLAIEDEDAEYRIEYLRAELEQ
jgi:tellurite resistance protein